MQGIAEGGDRFSEARVRGNEQNRSVKPRGGDRSLNDSVFFRRSAAISRRELILLGLTPQAFDFRHSVAMKLDELGR